MASSSSELEHLKEAKGTKSQKKSKRKLEYDDKSQAGTPKKSQSTSNKSTLISFFAKAKAPTYVSCPVCSTKIDHGFINQHLDRGCVIPDGGNNAASPNKPGKSTLSLQENGDPSKNQKNQRQKAALREGASDKRKRERLSRKYKSHEIYQSVDVTAISGDDSSQESQGHILGPMSWVDNKEDCGNDSAEADTAISCDTCETDVLHSHGDPRAPGENGMGCSSYSIENHSQDLTETTESSQSDLFMSSPSSSPLEECGTVTVVESKEKVVKQGREFSSSSCSHSSATSHKRLLSESEEGSTSSQLTVSVNKKMKLHLSRRRSKLGKRRASNEGSSEQHALLSASDRPVGDGLDSSGNTPEEIKSRPNGKSSGEDIDIVSPSDGQPSHDSLSPTSSPHKPKEPYYVSNFKFILNGVLGNEDDVNLLNEDDLNTISLYNDLSTEGQQLYIRIFQRKLAWIKVSKLQYPKIAEDMAPYAEEICQKGLFLNESGMADLEEVLRHLPAPEIKLLTKDLKVACPDGTQKADMVTACMRHCRRQKGLFGSSLRPLMLKKAKHYLGPCIKLCQRHRAVFTRICLLFSPVLMTDDEENASGGQNQLQALLLVNFGRVIYPEYQINRTRKVFRNRDDLIRYETALQYEHDIMGAMSTNDFDLASDLWRAARATQMEIHNDASILGYTKSLPVFLQHFTAPSVYEHIHYVGVEILQKQRQYREAVEELKLCLSTCEFRRDSRGSRWDRLALNLDQHLKDPDQALSVILGGLADEHVKTGHRLSLEQRAEKILSAPRNKKLAELRKHEFTSKPVTVEDLPTITIQGKILPYTGPGVKNVFVRSAGTDSGGDDGIELCSVEQVALDHYLQHGYTDGKHGEGSTFSTLIFLLFWEEIFMDIPDVFSYPYQSGPLDLRTDQFFPNREKALQRKLGDLRAADEGALTGWLEDACREHEGEACGGINWDLFTLDEAKSLLGCMGSHFISATAERLLGSHRHCRGGMPDLILWNTQTKKFKMSEVKGPGDRLSHKQILWIQFFQSIGADAEVCHVKGLKSKNLKHRQLQALKSSRSPRRGSSPKKSPSKSPHRRTPLKLKQKQT